MHGILFIQDLAVILVVAGAVGWLCQRIGLSVVVGFLAAGILVGPGMPYLALVSDVGRIEALAQVGLVFLMFSIGLRLSLRKLNRLGMPLLAAVFGSAIAMYYLSRLLAAALGWNSTEGLFLAGMLMISSSSIIGKILHETGLNHERAGQLATGVSVLEDIVAVVMLAVLGSVVQLGGRGASRASEVGVSLLHLGAFIAMIGVAGLIIVPWFLKRMSISMNEELQTLGLAALLFGLAILAQKAGLLGGARGLPARDHRGRDPPPPPGRAHVRGDARRVQRRLLRGHGDADRRPRAGALGGRSSPGSPRSRSSPGRSRSAPGSR
jgi:CPA2 family monovalent cation:H+ antiporter-2